jgi:hypothetical protein
VQRRSTRGARRPAGAGAEAEAEAAAPADGRHRGRGGGWRLPWQREWDAERQLHPRTAEAVLRKWQARDARRPGQRSSSGQKEPWHSLRCPVRAPGPPLRASGPRRGRLSVWHAAVRQRRQGVRGGGGGDYIAVLCRWAHWYKQGAEGAERWGRGAGRTAHHLVPQVMACKPWPPRVMRAAVAVQGCGSAPARTGVLTWGERARQAPARADR